MAAKKAKAAPAAPPARRTRSFEHGEAAAGARLRRSGFARTPEGDLAFALGFPWMRFVEDAPVTEELSVVMAKLDAEGAFQWRQALPEAVTIARVWSLLGPLRFGPQYEAFVRLEGAPPAPEAYAACLARGVPDAQGADEILRSLFTQKRQNARTLRGDLARVEAFVGPSILLDVLVRLIEDLAVRGEFVDNSGQAEAMDYLGHVLQRVPPREADPARERLERALTELLKRPLCRATMNLDVVLNGVVGAERSGYRSENKLVPASLVHVVDDAEWVASRLEECPPNCPMLPDARLVFTGGVRAYRAYLTHLAKYLKYKHPGVDQTFFADFADIDMPETVELMVLLATQSKVKKEALAWLGANAERATPWFAANEKGPHAEAIRAVRAKLG